MLEKKRESGRGAVEAPPHYHGHRERLRERCREAGDVALFDYELLELVLFCALPRRDVKPLAKALIATFGSFAEVYFRAGRAARREQGIGRCRHHRAQARTGGGEPALARRGEETAGAVVLGGRARLLPQRPGLCRP